MNKCAPQRPVRVNERAVSALRGGLNSRSTGLVNPTSGFPSPLSVFGDLMPEMAGTAADMGLDPELFL
jgi:hypothetical protein